MATLSQWLLELDQIFGLKATGKEASQGKTPLGASSRGTLSASTISPSTVSPSTITKDAMNWSDDPIVLHSYSQDLWPRKLLELREEGPKPPQVDGVVWPETAAQVSQLVLLASKANWSLIPYGAGSGVCGATVPSELETRLKIVVDLKKMHRVLEIDHKSMAVRAESGVLGENLERALNEKGFTLGHFPSSIYCSSLGGYLATRSAGQLSTKYGKIEDMVLSVEVVLPDGTMTTAGRVPRSAMGPDWTHFLLGTEGTLCFFTSAWLQIHPLPEARVFEAFGVQDLSVAIEFSRRLLQKGVKPAVLRIYDPIEVSLTQNSALLKECGFPGGALVIAVFEGLKSLSECEATEARQLAEQLGLAGLGSKLALAWWEHRYHVSYKQQLILSHQRMILDTFEVAATWDRLEEVYRAVKSISIGMGVVMAHLSHFYHTGANIYFTVVSHSGLKLAEEKYDQVWAAMLEKALSAGASLSHHHGVGALKNEWIRKEKGPWISYFRKVKNGFDPENRFNPYKMGL